ncbi:Gfo/Idh/MocA family protein [Dactylosporangium sp. CA-233914]|uniref:Gfo/Idh/MocA family protein n=1 Tax=Dactylosporangium sp. CA-233914 TaxID=3239934 RepID=UPI003D8A98EF
MTELRVALIGGGFMGKAHSLAYALAPIAQDLGVTLHKEVLVDVTPELAEEGAEQLGWRSSATDWEAVVARPDIDVIDICTPPDLHEPIALAAMAAGKHVFCEKPITNRADEAQRMADRARAAGVVAQVGFNYRHTPAISFTKQLLDSGRLGVPLQFRASYLQETSFNADPNRWRAKKSTGGSGTVGDIGSHIIDAAEWLFGDITRVTARVRAKAPGDGGWVAEEDRLGQDLIDDGGVWIAEFANGAIGTFAVNSFASGRKNRFHFELDASKGAVEFNWNNREEFRVSYVDEDADHQGFRTVHTNNQHPNGWWRLAGIGTGYVEVSAIQFQEFVRAIVRGERARPDFDDAARVQRIVEAVYTSAVSGQWIGIEARTGGAR